MAALACAVALRTVAMLGYRWQMWFPDSYGYVGGALHPEPGVIRPSGYPLLLWALRPLHSFAVVTGLQHLMGLGIGVMVYALLRRGGLPGWGAALAAAPVLFDAYQVELEHLVLSDALFAFLVMGAVTAMLWRYEVTLRGAVTAGLLLGLASVVRTVGLPLLGVFVLFLLARRLPLRLLVAAVVACVLPVAAYATWFTADEHRFGLTGSTGIFLYSRALAFADCSRIRPPAAEKALCVSRSSAASSVWSPTSPLHRLPGEPFDPYKNRLAGDFASRAVRAEPFAYLRVVGTDVARTFRPGHPVFPNPGTYRYYLFRFFPIRLAPEVDQRFRDYGHASPVTVVVQPYARFLRAYQRYVYVQGVVLGLIMLAGLVGVASRWRRFGGRAALPWGVAVALIVIPPATVEFDYRYVLPAVSPACVAAALTVNAMARSRRRVTAVRPPDAGSEPGEDPA